MTQKELIDRVAAETGVTKIDTGIMLKAIMRTVSDELIADGSIKLSELGTFSVIVIAEHEVNNPLFGGIMYFPEQKRVKFKASKGLKDRLNA